MDLTAEQELDAFQTATTLLIDLHNLVVRVSPIEAITIVIGHYEESLAKIARGARDPISLATIALQMGCVASPGRTVADVINGTEIEEIIARS